MTFTEKAFMDALDILNLHYPILIQRRKRRKNPVRPSIHSTLIKRLWRAGIATQSRGEGQGANFVVRGSLLPGISISGLRSNRLEEVIAILAWADKPEPEGDPPPMSDRLKNEVEESFAERYFDKPFDPDNPNPKKAKDETT